MALFPNTDKATWTVQEVQDAWMTEEGMKVLAKGDKCPCCGKHVQIYKRRLTRKMCLALLVFARYLFEHQTKEAHAEAVFKDHNSLWSDHSFAKLRFWGLIERVEGERPDGNPDNGFYRITKDGYAFLHGELEVATFCIEYLSKIQSYSDVYVTWGRVTEFFHYDRDVRNLYAFEPFDEDAVPDEVLVP